MTRKQSRASLEAVVLREALSWWLGHRPVAWMGTSGARQHRKHYTVNVRTEHELATAVLHQHRGEYVLRKGTHAGRGAYWSGSWTTKLDVHHVPVWVSQQRANRMGWREAHEVRRQLLRDFGHRTRVVLVRRPAK